MVLVRLNFWLTQFCCQEAGDGQGGDDFLHNLIQLCPFQHYYTGAE